jgi:hypothetical protein
MDLKSVDSELVFCRLLSFVSLCERRIWGILRDLLSVDNFLSTFLSFGGRFDPKIAIVSKE